MTPETEPKEPPTWGILLAFAIIYFCWGTTYLAIRVGVHDENLPPALFGGTRILIAGLLLFAYQVCRGQSLRMPRRELLAIFGVSWLLFVGGNGLMTAANRTVDSGVSAVLAATTPLWLGMFAMFWPKGDRLTARGWLGLTMGLLGILILMMPKLSDPGHFVRDFGPLMVLGSAAAWALGSLILRNTRFTTPHITNAAYQLMCGGTILTLLGLAMGEHRQLPDQVTFGAVAAYSYLLIAGSLMGYVAFNWLLIHVSAAKVGTYAYVNPVIAVLVGWIAGEGMSVWLIGGITVILFGVFLVRGGEQHAEQSTGEQCAGEQSAGAQPAQVVQAPDSTQEPV